MKFSNERTAVTLSLYFTIIFAEKTFPLDTPIQSGPSYTYTKLSRHGYNIGNSDCIVFEAKACKAVHIGFMVNNAESPAMYEVLFGGWTNKKSVIRRGKWHRDLKAQANITGILSCTEFRKFKISLYNGKITGYTWQNPCSWKELLSWQDPVPLSINTVGVTTGKFANGQWIIYNQECRENHCLNTHRFTWRQDIDKKDQTYSSPKYRINDPVSFVECIKQCQRHDDCCYVTYNNTLCLGFSHMTSSPVTSIGTQFWLRN